MNNRLLTDTYNLFSMPRNEREQQQQYRAAMNNPDAFAGIATADVSYDHKTKAETSKTELSSLFLQALIQQVEHQFKKLYQYGGFVATGAAWEASLSMALADFDNIIERHQLDDHQAVRGREILEELQDISKKKANNEASDTELRQGDALMNEAFALMPNVMNEYGALAQEITHNTHTVTITEPQDTLKSKVQTDFVVQF